MVLPGLRYTAQVWPSLKQQYCPEFRHFKSIPSHLVLCTVSEHKPTPFQEKSSVSQDQTKHPWNKNWMHHCEKQILSWVCVLSACSKTLWSNLDTSHCEKERFWYVLVAKLYPQLFLSYFTLASSYVWNVFFVFFCQCCFVVTSTGSTPARWGERCAVWLSGRRAGNATCIQRSGASWWRMQRRPTPETLDGFCCLVMFSACSLLVSLSFCK